MLTLLENVGRYVHFAARALVALPGAICRPRALANRLLDILFWADPKAVGRWFDLHERDFGIRKPR